MGVSLHVQGDTLLDVMMGADAVDGLLHLTVAAVASFDGVGSGRQQLVVEEGQGLLQVGREELGEGTADLLEAADAAAEFG